MMCIFLQDKVLVQWVVFVVSINKEYLFVRDINGINNGIYGIIMQMNIILMLKLKVIYMIIELV